MYNELNQVLKNSVGISLRHSGYVYKEKGYWAHGVVRMKCKVSGEWYLAVFYTGALDGLFFVRELNDFLNKFKHSKELEESLLAK